MISRRDFLAGVAFLPALGQFPSPSGRLVATIPFGIPGAPTTPLNRLLGAGLDARLFTDLSQMSADAGVTPTDRFFVRTATPPALPDPAAWKIDFGGLVEPIDPLDVASL